MPKPIISNLKMFSQILTSILSSITCGTLNFCLVSNKGCSYGYKDYQVPLADCFVPSPSQISH